MMGSCCYKKRVKVIHNIRKESDFQMPKDEITISFDENFEVTISEVDFEGFLKAFTR